VNPEESGRLAADAVVTKTCPSCGAKYTADALFCSLDGSPLTTSPAAIAAAAKTDPYLGREILGHIELRQLVGIGAMGRVYRAFQKGIDRDVAVKILHRELSANQTLVSRFNREAKVASRLAHPHVVHVLLVGQLPDGAMYIVMEYLDGMSLQSALAAAGGAIPLPRALHIAVQLCDAAGEAHAQGIVHRDLKPENVMLVQRADDPDYVKVLDFGIARLHWGDQSMATAAGLIFGTARYISPEGAQGEKVGPQGDVYSIATMTYQMIAGRTPFGADQAVALLVQQIHDPPPPIDTIPRASYLPEPIAAAIMRNLSKKPEGRAETARAFGRELLEAAMTSGLSAQDILARPAMLTGRRGEASSVVQMPSMQRTDKMQLEPQLEARMAARPPPRNGTEALRATKTAFETPAETTVEAPPFSGGGRTFVRTEIPDPDPPRSVATTKWIPPSDFEARLRPPPSSVDATMDEQQAILSRPAPLLPTQSGEPAPLSIPSARQAPQSMQPAGPAAPSMPSTVGPQPDSRTAATAPPASRAPSVVETNEGEATAVRRLMQTKWQRPAVAALSLLLAALTVLVASKSGLLGRTQGAPLAALVTRANDALSHKRWDSPPGDNVRDLTDQGLARWPRDPQLSEIRARAAGEIVKAARAKAGDGDQGEALRLLRVANALDPTNEEARALLAGWSRDVATNTPSAADSPVPPLLNGRPSAMTAGGSGSLRAVIDASNGKPGVGQPVDFSARILAGPVASHAKVDGAHFRISGPGIGAGTDLPVADDGSGAFRTTFTFLQGGKFEVTFLARADGSQVRSTRIVAVDAPASAPPLPATAPPPAPAPSSSAQWL
jgi:serine/threonine-protein kinase